jgi:hypothetical protein
VQFQSNALAFQVHLHTRTDKTHKKQSRRACRLAQAAHRPSVTRSTQPRASPIRSRSSTCNPLVLIACLAHYPQQRCLGPPQPPALGSGPAALPNAPKTQQEALNALKTIVPSVREYDSQSERGTNGAAIRVNSQFCFQKSGAERIYSRDGTAADAASGCRPSGPASHWPVL